MKNKVNSNNDKLETYVIDDLVEITEPWYECYDSVNIINITRSYQLDKWKFLFDISENTEEIFNRAKEYLDIVQDIAYYLIKKQQPFRFLPFLKVEKPTFELPKINGELEYLNLFLKHKFFYKESYSFHEKEDTIFIHIDKGLKKIRKYHKKNDDGKKLNVYSVYQFNEVPEHLDKDAIYSILLDECMFFIKE